MHVTEISNFIFYLMLQHSDNFLLEIISRKPGKRQK